jgi:hypothetical protein
MNARLLVRSAPGRRWIEVWEIFVCDVEEVGSISGGAAETLTDSCTVINSMGTCTSCTRSEMAVKFTSAGAKPEAEISIRYSPMGTEVNWTTPAELVRSVLDQAEFVLWSLTSALEMAR